MFISVWYIPVRVAPVVYNKRIKMFNKNRHTALLSFCIVLTALSSSVFGQKEKPNILVIMGDDVGIPNISAYSHGMMGYKTPHIDQLAKEGVMFTDYYGEQSCTAGRSAFITGQHIIRTGLSKVGLPGAPEGITPDDITLGGLLQAQGYATGQFGKNHFGDQDKHLPTNNGFDEFFGNLYHLNAEEEPENEDYPTDPAFKQKFGPRGVISATSDGKIEDTGPLTAKRMETVDDEFMAAAMDFVDRQHAAEKPWFVWFNTTRMHFWTHVREENRGKSGLNEYADGMLEIDDMVGLWMQKLKDLGVDENTIVIFTTDNGVHAATWPDAGVTWFNNEKTTNWEGGFRVPCIARFPGVEPGSINNDVMSHLDWVPTVMAAVGEENITQKLLDGYSANGRDYKIHLDGYNFLPRLKGEVDKGPRNFFIYGTDAAQISAIRFDDRWKAIYMEQKSHGTRVWIDDLVKLKAPLLFDLRMDPFEKALHTNTYWDWYSKRIYLLGRGAMYVVPFIQSFEDYPPSQTPATWNLDKLLEQYMPKD
jgi:arylsulfatase